MLSELCCCTPKPNKHHFYLSIAMIFFFSLMFAVIENLPMEMRDRLTEMREMDLQVQSKYLIKKLFVRSVKCPFCIRLFLVFWIFFLYHWKRMKGFAEVKVSPYLVSLLRWRVCTHFYHHQWIVGSRKKIKKQSLFFLSSFICGTIFFFLSLIFI